MLIDSLFFLRMNVMAYVLCATFLVCMNYLDALRDLFEGNHVLRMVMKPRRFQPITAKSKIANTKYSLSKASPSSWLWLGVFGLAVSDGLFLDWRFQMGCFWIGGFRFGCIGSCYALYVHVYFVLAF